jgi:hypothetical protein
MAIYRLGRIARPLRRDDSPAARRGERETAALWALGSER